MIKLITDPNPERLLRFPSHILKFSVIISRTMGHRRYSIRYYAHKINVNAFTLGRIRISFNLNSVEIDGSNQLGEVIDDLVERLQRQYHWSIAEEKGQ
jgi:hypothetical protein